MVHRQLLARGGGHHAQVGRHHAGDGASVVQGLLQVHALQVRRDNAPTPAGAALPLVVSVMRDRPWALRGLAMRIPLWSDPVDMVAVAELAQEVMCGTRLACTASYSQNPVATLAGAAALADAWDPVLQLRR